MDASPLHATFQKKYDEFVADLRETFPELEAALTAAAAVRVPASLNRYKAEVARKTPEVADIQKCPGMVLPGVKITEELWAAVGEKTKRAVHEYVAILNLCAMYDGGFEDFAKDPEKVKAWADNVTKEWRSRMDRVDFDSLGEKFKNMFGTEGAMPKLPEKFLKGKLAKLAEDLVREFKPEDFGLRPEDLAAVEKDPTRAFEILMQASGSNPEMLQKAMMRVGKRLQEKVQRGELKPEELAAEAEELMKDFQSNPAFTEMMGAFRSAFSFEDPDLARAAGRDNEGRLALVRNRLRKKLEAKKAAAGKR
jgi:hypothetical protein